MPPLSASTQPTMLDHALDYAANGWPVFPCDPATKAPLVARGLYSATTDEPTINRWWTHWPAAMIGLPTGSPTGVWVLDVDLKDDGPAQLAALIATHGPLPDTFTVDTASGGQHFYFQHAEGVRNRGKFAPGLDVRGEGGYVIAAHSVRDDGTFYDLAADHEPAPAPAWLLELVVKRQAAPAVPSASNDNAPYVEAAVSGEISKLVSTRTHRNDALNDASFNLGTLVGAGALSRGEAETRLYGAAVANGYVSKDGEKAARDTITSGLDSGESNPRQIPEREHNSDEDLTPWLPTKLLAKHHSAEPAAPAPAAEQPAIYATPFQWIDPKDLPRREFVYGTHLIRKYVSVTVSPGGLGKTSLTIAEALAMVTGRPLLGTKPSRALNVWLFNAEDPRDEMERRIMAGAMQYRLKPNDLAGLFLDSGREQDLVIAFDDKRGVKIATPIVEAVKEQIRSNNIDVMIVDPFVSTHSVSENDNGAIDKVAKLWAKIADETNCAIELVHHVRKSEGRDVTVEDARGAVSLLAAARSARVLNRMTTEQASEAGVPAGERFSYFSVARGKANLAPMSGHMEWRRLISVPLGNGQGLTRPQDHAGVVVEWQWPGSEDVVETISADQKAHICSLVDTGDYKEAPQAKNWAGYAVAFALGLDAEDAAQKKHAGSFLKALLKEGVLVKKSERDPITRKVATFIRSADFQ